MSRKRFKAEQVIGMLREEDVKLSQGRSGVGLSGNGYVKVNGEKDIKEIGRDLRMP